MIHNPWIFWLYLQMQMEILIPQRDQELRDTDAACCSATYDLVFQFIK